MSIQQAVSSLLTTTKKGRLDDFELKCMRHRKCPTTLLTWAVGLNVKRLFYTSSAHFTRLWGSALSPSQSAPKGQRKSLDRVPAGGGSRFRGTSKYPFHGRAVMSSPNSLNCQINWERQTHTCVYSCQLVLLCVNSSDGVMWELPPLAHLQYWNLKPACFEVRVRAHTHAIFGCPLLHVQSFSVCLLKCTSENIWQI